MVISYSSKRSGIQGLPLLSGSLRGLVFFQVLAAMDEL